MPPARDVKMNLPQSSGLETSPPKMSLEWKAWGSPEWEQGRTVGDRVGEASKHPLLLFSASMDTVPGIRGTNLVPLVTHLQAHCSQMLTVITQSWSSGHPILKKKIWESGESTWYPTWLITLLILVFPFKRPNLLRTLLKEHVKSFQIKEKPVCVYVHFNLWEIFLWSGCHQQPCHYSRVLLANPPHQCFATYFLRSWSVRPLPFCTYLFNRLKCHLWEYNVQ